jgi:hypothetical protein
MAVSFYVPRIRETWTEYHIYSALYHTLGIVERVDFGETIQPGLRYAFVHMNLMNPTFSEKVNQEMTKNGHFKLQVTANEFWMLIPNKNPIAATHLNVHQLAEITKKQDERIDFLESMVLDLKAQIETLTNINSRKPGTISLACDSLEGFRENLDNNKKFCGIDFEKDVKVCYKNWQEVGLDPVDEYADMPELISPNN